MTMAIDRKRLNDANMIDLTRAEAESDRQRAISRRQQALLAAAGMDGRKRWAILKVASRRENDVDKSLCAAFIDHWLPLRKADQPHHGGRKGVAAEPVYQLAWPGYMFVHVVDSDAAWAGLLGVKHVVAVLGVGERPFFVSDEKLLRIKAELATLKDARQAAKLFAKGQKVRVTDGPFASFPGVVAHVGNGRQEGRAQVEVMIFGRVTPVELQLAQLAKMD